MLHGRKAMPAACVKFEGRMFNSKDTAVEVCGYKSVQIPTFDPSLGVIIWRWISMRQQGLLDPRLDAAGLHDRDAPK